MQAVVCEFGNYSLVGNARNGWKNAELSSFGPKQLIGDNIKCNLISWGKKPSFEILFVMLSMTSMTANYATEHSYFSKQPPLQESKSFSIESWTSIKLSF